MSWYRAHKPQRRKPVFLGTAAIGVLLIVAALAMIVIPSGAAGSSNKTLNCTTISPSSPVAANGSSVTFDLNLCNDPTSPNQLGSADVTAPTGFTITGACYLTVSPCGAWPSVDSIASPILHLRNLSIAAGTS